MDRVTQTGEATLSLVGGAGRMGLLLARLLKGRFTVKIVSRDPERAKEAADLVGAGWAQIETAHESDVVVVAVPIDRTVEVCRSLAERMRPHSLLVDLASVKTGITYTVRDSTPPTIEYLSLHPLFGPQVQDIAGKRLIAVEARGGSMTESFLRVLQDLGARIWRATVEEHDRAMAAVQVLHHHALLTFASTLGQVASNSDLSPYVTESLERTMQNLKSMQENWETILLIQRCNPHARRVREAFAKAAADHLELDEHSRVNLRRSIMILGSRDDDRSG
ncbi:prephenate dehydrogenase/arogenate dehydrogenase family protein [Candidatus Bathyarchaeota archaeon]|nr:prephenate dehydrogenase/arogenate dehydrogenase family protein [Candidatus Bathyarchaeota archaeon]